MTPPRRRAGRAVVVALALVASATGSCRSDDRSGADPDPAATDPAPDLPSMARPAWLEDDLGGGTTRRALRGRPFNQVARYVTNAELARFSDGAAVFDRRVRPDDGLGPDFDDDGCLSCHLDGTGRGEVTDVPPGLIQRVDAAAGGVAGLGPQLQTRSTVGEPEAVVDLEWEEVAGRFPDGTPHELRRPAHRVSTRSPLPADTSMSARMAPPMVGVGLLEAIPDSALRAAADPDDADGDGISGRVHEVADPTDPIRRVVGRFGWKATQPTVASQTVAALEADMGVTASGPDAEMGAAELADMIFYNRTIAVPVGRSFEEARVERGAAIFEHVGCTGCHTPTQRSGPDTAVRSDRNGGNEAVAALADQTFHPFTDLLLHDLGPGLDDGMVEGDAAGSEWRTAPLWGLGRRVETTRRRAFLHDGRARTPTEAILWHDGEAAASRRRFEALSPRDRADLAAFLDAL